jgi:hypothetical protein
MIWQIPQKPYYSKKDKKWYYTIIKNYERIKTGPIEKLNKGKK